MAMFPGLMGLLGGQQPQAQVPGAMPPSQTGGLLQRLLAPEFALPMAAGMMGNQGNAGNFGQGFQNAAPMMMLAKQKREQDAQKNQTLAYLQKANPELAAMVANGMPVAEAWQTLTKQRFDLDKGQGFINAGGGNLFNSETGEWVSAPGGGVEGVAGLTPVWIRDKNGKPVLAQMRKDGSVVQSTMPDGTEAIPPFDLNFDKASGTEAGKGVGEAQIALPGVMHSASKIESQVTELKNDPYLGAMLGPIDSRLPNVSENAARVQSKIAQLGGDAFLAARQALKGGGAITDMEGARAEAALARLNTAQSEADFKAALDEFNAHVQRGMQLLAAQAGQQRMDTGAAPSGGGSHRLRYNPATGELE